MFVAENKLRFYLLNKSECPRTFSTYPRNVVNESLGKLERTGVSCNMIGCNKVVSWMIFSAFCWIMSATVN